MNYNEAMALMNASDSDADSVSFWQVLSFLRVFLKLILLALNHRILQEIRDYAGRNRLKEIYCTWNHSDNVYKESYKNGTKPIGRTKEITLCKAQNFTAVYYSHSSLFV